MLRGGEGQKEGRAVLRHTLFSGPPGGGWAHLSEGNQSISEMEGQHGALGITLGMAQLLPASASGDNGALQAELR